MQANNRDFSFSWLVTHIFGIITAAQLYVDTHRACSRHDVFILYCGVLQVTSFHCETQSWNVYGSTKGMEIKWKFSLSYNHCGFRVGSNSFCHSWYIILVSHPVQRQSTTCINVCYLQLFWCSSFKICRWHCDVVTTDGIYVDKHWCNCDMYMQLQQYSA